MSAEPNEQFSRLVRSAHFYESGDVTLEVDGVLFRVHAGENNPLLYAALELTIAGSDCKQSYVRNQKCSRTCSISSTLAAPIDFQLLEPMAISCFMTILRSLPSYSTYCTTTCKQRPLCYEIILINMYASNRDFTPLTVKQHLQLILLAHKYEIPSILGSCQPYLRGYLPTSITPRDFRNLRYYHDDPSITPKVIRASTLAHMQELLPWALYFFAIQSDLDQDELLSEADVALREAYSLQLITIHSINKRSIKVWNQSITRFMKDYCCTEWWSEEDECWRRTELLDIGKSSFILAESLEDPLQGMYEALDFCSQDLCSLCADALTRRANRVMASVLERIREDILGD